MQYHVYMVCMHGYSLVLLNNIKITFKHYSVTKEQMIFLYINGIKLLSYVNYVCFDIQKAQNSTW